VSSDYEPRRAAALTIPVPDAADITLSWPQRLTEAQWEHVMAVLEAMKPGLVRPDPEPALPQPALSERDLAELAALLPDTHKISEQERADYFRGLEERLEAARSASAR
jgi:hypothetical protein